MYLNDWANVLLGTHLDEVKREQAEEYLTQLQRKYCPRFRNIVHLTAVSTYTGRGVGTLKNELIRIATKQV
jgi:selenocysteine-specific translation elongation factor